MKGKLTLSILISLLMILGASWNRFTQAEQYVAEIQVAENEIRNEAYIKPFDSIKEKTAGDTPKENLSDTDLVARQFAIDYLGLISKGQATDKNLESLADFYAENISSIVTAPRVTIADIQVVQDSRQNLISYGTTLAKIYFKYEDRLQKEMNKINTTESPIDNTNISIATKMGLIYKDYADELKNVPVPVSVVEKHTRLINAHLASYANFTLVKDIEKDPAKAFAAIASQKEVDKSIDSLWIEISDVFKTYAL